MNNIVICSYERDHGTVLTIFMFHRFIFLFGLISFDPYPIFRFALLKNFVKFGFDGGAAI